MKICLLGAASDDVAEWLNETTPVIEKSDFTLAKSTEEADYVLYLMESNQNDLLSLEAFQKNLDKFIVIGPKLLGKSYPQAILLKQGILRYSPYRIGSGLVRVLADSLTTRIHIVCNNQTWKQSLATTLDPTFFPVMDKANEADLIIWQLTNENFLIDPWQDGIPLIETFFEWNTPIREQTLVFSDSTEPNWLETRAFCTSEFANFWRRIDIQSMIRFIRTYTRKNPKSFFIRPTDWFKIQ